jgi:hypothetical protein
MIKTIHIHGARYYDKASDNTYHSCKVFVNNRLVLTCAFEYGYGDQYIETAAQALHKNGVIDRGERHKGGSWEPLWRVCQEQDIVLTHECEDTTKQRVKAIGNGEL